MISTNICKFVPSVNEEGLKIEDFVYESTPESMSRTVRQGYNRIILVTSGSGQFTLNETELLCKTGDILFSFEGELFSAVPKEDLKYIYITFHGTRAEELLRRFGINRYSRRFSGCEGLIPTWREAISVATNDNVDLVAESMLLYAFSRFGKRDSAGDSLVNKIIEISESDFTSPDLTLAEVAKRLSYNSKYISHVFKEKMGMAYTEYLRMLRMKYAISLFEHGLDSIKNVAILSGFTDPLYFSTVFKQTVGMSPKEYISRRNEHSADVESDGDGE